MKEESTYKVIEVIGTSNTSWEDAARSAVETVSKHVHDIRIAEVDKLDMKVEGTGVVSYRARLLLSFKYHEEDR